MNQKKFNIIYKNHGHNNNSISIDPRVQINLNYKNQQAHLC